MRSWNTYLILVVVVVSGAAAVLGAELYQARAEVRTLLESAANDTALRQGAREIAVGVNSWAVDHGDSFPPPGVVDRRSLISPAGKSYARQWPANPFTGEPVHAGSAPGDYLYARTGAGLGYRLIVMGAGGKPAAIIEISPTPQ